MPRKPRFYLPGIPVHIVQRGNCRQSTFFADGDYIAYLDWLNEGAERFGCAVHAYVLMTNHVHLLVTPEEADSVSRLVQHVGRLYVTYVNRVRSRSGTLWEGRHKGCPVSTARYFLACMRYIELNPVRAGMVGRPYEYRWSSYRGNACGMDDPVLTRHPVYLELGKHRAGQLRNYRMLFTEAFDDAELHMIRATLQTGTPLGSEDFRQRLEQTLGRATGHWHRGRPIRDGKR